MILAGAAAAALAGCSLRDTFSGTVRVAARAAGDELAVEELAQAVAAGLTIPTERDMMVRWTHRWVEYSLFAQRVATGDSLLDSATVVRVMWPGVYRAVVGAFHDQLIAERLDVDRAVDSTYAAGDLRLIRHILIRTRPDMSPADRLAAQRKAEGIWGRLVNGESWARANEQNEDPGAKQRGGSLGVVQRGETVPEFEAVAFALGPGELSRVSQTSFGFHIVQRPELTTVREEYAAAIEGALVQRVDSAYLAELEGRWQIRIKRGAAPAMREAAQVPYLAGGSDRVLGTYRDGRFTVADFARWLATRSAREQQLIPVADDEQLTEFAHSLIRNEVLMREARFAGMPLAPASLAELTRQLGEIVTQLRTALALDSAMAGLLDRELRRQAALEAADRYFRRLAVNVQDAVVVPSSLAERLKEESDWGVSYAGVEQARQRAIALRAQGAATPAAPEASDAR